MKSSRKKEMPAKHCVMLSLSGREAVRDNLHQLWNNWDPGADKVMLEGVV